MKVQTVLNTIMGIRFEDEEQSNERCRNYWKYIKCISCKGFDTDCGDYETDLGRDKTYGRIET